MGPDGEGRNPEARAVRQAPHVNLALHALHEVAHPLAPPVDDAPTGGLLLACEELDHGASLGLRSGLDQPVMQVEDVHEVHVDPHSGRPRLLGGQRVAPPVAVVLGKTHHALHLLERDGALLRALDVALEVELLRDLGQVLRVVVALEREQVLPLLLRPDRLQAGHGPLGTDEGRIGYEGHVTTPPLPLCLLEPHPDVVAVVDHMPVDHVDLPTRPHAELQRLGGHLDDQGAVPVEAVVAAGMAELQPRQAGQAGEDADGPAGRQRVHGRARPHLLLQRRLPRRWSADVASDDELRC
mmetsp:Transcript_14380/g.42803  ORF Transcript_14380/g.42803 Transcript_14380/m.42803 type:complete len:297 (-) Transcript_14380:99-989(-)